MFIPRKESEFPKQEKGEDHNKEEESEERREKSEEEEEEFEGDGERVASIDVDTSTGGWRGCGVLVGSRTNRLVNQTG